MDKLSCLCLTMSSRTEFLTHAVECFNRQTWENKELVIVADADCDLELMRRLGPDAVIVMCEGKPVIGTKRNIGCEHSTGSYIAVWDDDDHSAPTRIAFQHEVLQQTKKSVCSFMQIPFVNEKGEWYLSLPHGIGPNAKVGIGSSLFFSRDWWESHKFLDVMCGEDGDFARRAYLEDQLKPILHRDNFLMYGTNHSGNTSDRTFPGPSWFHLKDFVWNDAA